MLNKIVIGVLLLVVVALPSTVLGQHMPHGKWWHDSKMSKHLDLSKEEKNSLDEQFVETHRKMIDLKGNVEKERFELENLLESETLNENAVMEQFERLEKARTALAVERFNFLMHVRKTLGFERFQTIKMLHKKMRREGRHRMREHPEHE
jgi:Spy/CpxP family protein refolding chaperone